MLVKKLHDIECKNKLAERSWPGSRERYRKPPKALFTFDLAAFGRFVS